MASFISRTYHRLSACGVYPRSAASLTRHRASFRCFLSFQRCFKLACSSKLITVQIMFAVSTGMLTSVCAIGSLISVSLPYVTVVPLVTRVPVVLDCGAGASIPFAAGADFSPALVTTLLTRTCVDLSLGRYPHLRRVLLQVSSSGLWRWRPGTHLLSQPGQTCVN